MAEDTNDGRDEEQLRVMVDQSQELVSIPVINRWIYKPWSYGG